MTADIVALCRAFEQQFGRAPELIAEAPGRVNLIGEHTDYNGGFVLPIAVDRTVAVALAPRSDHTIRAFSLDFAQCDEFPADRVRRFLPGGKSGAVSRGWRDYVRGVVWALQEAQQPVRGADIAITGDVPQGAGLSSSAALEVAVAGALTIPPVAQGPSPERLRELALTCQKAENLFVGVQCGIMDQMTSALGRAGNALLIDCRSLEAEPVPLPPGIAIVVIDSRVPRRLADTAYNLRREESAQAARVLGVDSLRDADEAMLSRLNGDLLKRARHVVAENGRVLAAAEVLRGGDLNRLGELLYASHASLRDDFEVSTPELDSLVDIARSFGAIGARLTGAGFGGCTVNLVAEEAAGRFVREVVAKYGARTGLEAEGHVCRAVDGLRVRNA